MREIYLWMNILLFSFALRNLPSLLAFRIRSLGPAWSNRSRDPMPFSRAFESATPPPREIDSMEEDDEEYWDKILSSHDF